MKIFSGKGKTLNRTTAAACAGINLLATPGLGTLMAGRFVAGIAQLAAAAAGFGLILWWYSYMFRAMVNSTEAGHAWMWELGLLLFAVGWLGSLWSSVVILREAKSKIPPKLDGSAG